MVRGTMSCLNPYFTGAICACEAWMEGLRGSFTVNFNVIDISPRRLVELAR